MFPDLKELKEIGERIATALEKINATNEKCMKFIKACVTIGDKYMEKVITEDMMDDPEIQASIEMYEELKEAVSDL